MSDSKDDGNANNNNGIQTFLRIRPAAGTTYFHRDDIDLNSIAVKLPKHSEIINNSQVDIPFHSAEVYLMRKLHRRRSSLLLVNLHCVMHWVDTTLLYLRKFLP